MGLYLRTIQSAIEASLFHQKIAVIYGPRQVGKTTLVRAIMEKQADSSLYLNCDEPDIRQALTERSSTELKFLIGNHRLIVIDEAQRVKNIGITLKLMVDNFPDIQVIATGSASFELSNQISEPLTGRKVEFHLYPLSIDELLSAETGLENRRLLPNRLRFGSYPGVIGSPDPENTIAEIAGSYLYRDVVEYQVVRNKDLLQRLLQALALQVGSEVALTELGSLLGVDKATIERYLNLLQQAYIVFQLTPFSRNLRKELGKKRKVYFYDLGVRNALLNNFNPPELRSDIGGMWENFVISERIKYLQNHGKRANVYFWRTYSGAEIDYLEEREGKLFGLECKWSGDKWKPSSLFTSEYPNSEVHLVNHQNYLDFFQS